MADLNPSSDEDDAAESMEDVAAKQEVLTVESKIELHYQRCLAGGGSQRVCDLTAEQARMQADVHRAVSEAAGGWQRVCG